MTPTLAHMRRDNSTLFAVGGLLGIFILLGLIIAGHAADRAMAIQAWTFVALTGAFFVGLGMWWTNFGRLRPLHTSAVIFAFGGNALIATRFYVVQRTCRRGCSAAVALVRVLGLPALHRAGGTGYLLGITSPRNTPSRNGTPTCG
jgi:cbb3-type cytochrome oxidase subunit 1